MLRGGVQGDNTQVLKPISILSCPRPKDTLRGSILPGGLCIFSCKTNQVNLRQDKHNGRPEANYLVCKMVQVKETTMISMYIIRKSRVILSFWFPSCCLERWDGWDAGNPGHPHKNHRRHHSRQIRAGRSPPKGSWYHEAAGAGDPWPINIQLPHA